MADSEENVQRRPNIFWTIPELVAMTMQSASPSALAACARVSKVVSEHALDALYRETNGFMPLLRLLCPMERTFTDPCWNFTSPISPAHWDRFKHYSNRIHFLSVDNEGHWEKYTSPEALAEFLITRPRGEDLLPSLSRLEWMDGSQRTKSLAVAILHDRLEEILLELAEADFPVVVEHLVRRAPRLRSLHLTISSAEVDAPRPDLCLANAIRQLSSLSSVKVPWHFIAMGQLTTLLQLPRLKTLWLTPFGLDKSVTKLDHTEEDISGSEVPGITDLSVDSAVLWSIRRSIGSMTRLSSLHLEIVDMNHVHRSLHLISHSCHSLKHFSMIVRDHRTGQTLLRPSRFTFAMLAPLLNMHGLQTLVIEHPTPPNLNDHDLGRLADSLPELRRLEICVRAYGVEERDVPTLGCLIPFAQKCRHLVHIGIWFDADAECPALDRLTDEITFSPSLKSIAFYGSRLRSSRQLRRADFLASILSPNAELRVSEYSTLLDSVIGDMEPYQYTAAPRDPDNELELYTQSAHWEGVRDILSRLRTTRSSRRESSSTQTST
ncbi:hypothetical protein SISSUDRAFT_1127659 [Sistotremastrum suecicum HHB10207 ss-3]|uniref:F-box domain-containing protein n=1 Tax=Sistotremastrum suecicum HHB10207 ss-3 TaxID=1314776 RepID=A0A166ETT3_9AGAM|nr:hypothetical protein SISSUDRAFT_1127659 [Sistotremastrum suecicum HHB10207 ss-3]